MSEPEVVISEALGAWLALRRLDRGYARTDMSCMHMTESGSAVYRALSQVRGLWLATDRSIPFGSAAAHLLGAGDDRYG